MRTHVRRSETNPSEYGVYCIVKGKPGPERVFHHDELRATVLSGLPEAEIARLTNIAPGTASWFEMA